MSEHELDPLRHVDRPHDLEADADERIRTSMFDAFDEATDHPTHSPGPPDSTDSEVELTSRAPTAVSGDVANLDVARAARRSRRFVRLAAAVAVVLGIVGVVVVASLDRDESAPADDPDVVAAVAAYCSSVFNPLVDDVAGMRNTSIELIDRALRNLELMAQGWAGVGSDLDGPDGTAIIADADELLHAAADVRRAMSVDTTVDDVAAGVESLASSVADAVESAPGSTGCRTKEMSG